MYTIDDIQIFITTYNRSAYLKEAIESILNQSAKVKEIIVLDNDSPDDTENVVNSYSNKGAKYENITDRLRKRNWILGFVDIISHLKSKKYQVESIEKAILKFAI